MSDVRISWSPEQRRRIDNYHRRRKTYAETGPAAILEYLRASNEAQRKEAAEEELPEDFSGGLDIMLHETASHDVGSLPVEEYDPEKHVNCIDLAEAILYLQGFRFSAAIGKAALRAYIFHLIEHLGLGWCDEREEMADCLIEMYQRRGGEVPCRWTWEEWSAWWRHPW